MYLSEIVPNNPPQTLSETELFGMRLAHLDRHGLVEYIFNMLRNGLGGWVVTANLDFLRRYVRAQAYRSLYDDADIRVADGMPLVWAARLQGQPLPERVPGSSMVWLLIERALREERVVCFLGGAEGANERALAVIHERYPSLSCVGQSPMISSPPTREEVASLRAWLEPLNPDLLFVGLGSPKQEQLIQLLRPYFPKAWMVGIGVSFSFIAGDLRRAPHWMQAIGAEWMYRMFQDPKRLFRRYLLEDLPFAFRLFPHSLWKRIRRHR
jgi:N-acetylglucosaminyldiphosphoundecaprenol N-acetyl-beta-D-mannosaminyltransferase